LNEVAEFNPKSALPDTFEYVDLESVVGTDLISHRTESKATAPSRAQRLAQRGDVFYQTVRPYQKNNYLFDLPCNDYVFSTGYAQMRPNIDSRFLFSRIQEERFVKAVLDRCTGTSYPAINANDLYEIEIVVPTNKDEQVKIGSLFRNFDHLITLHQRKLDKTKKLKKAFLNLIFGQKLRFYGFNDSWELRKLGEVVTRVQGNDGRMNLPTLTISASNGWLDQRDRFSSNIAGNEQKNYTLLKKGELSYNHGNSKLAKYGTVFVLRNSQEALVPRVYHSFKTTLLADADFIEYIFSTKNPDRELAKLISSGARMDGLLNISYDDFIGIKISLPQKVEQQKIALFFRSIDNLITLHQEKINQLTKLKTTFLKNMFI
jgi:type I restriction enzyme S subunit